MLNPHKKALSSIELTVLIFVPWRRIRTKALMLRAIIAGRNNLESLFVAAQTIVRLDARRKLPAEGRSACGAKSRYVQWRHHRVAGWVFLRSQAAA